jgi:Helix-turn-helix domain
MRMLDVNQPANDDEAHFLTAREVAEMLNVSVDTVYRHVPCTRIASGVIRYSPVAVKRFLDEKSLPSARRPRRRFTLRKSYV